MSSIAMGGPAACDRRGAGVKFSAKSGFLAESVLGLRGFIPADIQDAIDLYLDGTLSVEHLTGAVRPLEEAADALADLRAGRVFRSVLMP
jgi:Zn-dependent alcohol dehydrogenase